MNADLPEQLFSFTDRINENKEKMNNNEKKKNTELLGNANKFSLKRKLKTS